MKIYMRATGLTVAMTLCMPIAAHAQTETAEVDEVIVLSSPTLKAASDIISVTHIIDANAITEDPTQTIGDLISDLPGVDSASHGPAVGRPVIRGLSGYRVGTLENGLGIADVSSTANDHANALNLFEQQRVEVLKGPSALRYGPYANTGVVNSFNRHFDADAQAETQLIVGGNTVSDQTLSSVFARRVYDDISLAFSAFDQESTEIRVPTHAESAFELTEEGEDIIDVSQDVANTSTASDGITVSARMGAPGSQLTIVGSSVDLSYGIPGHAHGGGSAITIGMQRDTVRAVFKQDLTGAFERLEAHAHQTNFEQIEYDNGSPETIYGRDVDELKLDFFNAPVNGWSGIIGVSWKTGDLSTSGEEAFLPSTDDDEIAAYIVQSRETGEWITEFALRLDDVSVESPTQKKTYDLVNLSGGAGYRLDENSLLGASVSLTERAPSATELFSDGVHAAVSRYERGSTNLETEESVASEVYYRRSFGAADIQVSAFQNDYDNFIYLKGDGTQLESTDVFDYKQADAEVYGFEVSAATEGSIDMADWSARFSYANLTGELTDGTPLRSIPPEKYGVHGELTRGDMSLGLDVVHADDQTDTPSDQFATDGYTEVNADLTWSPAMLTGVRVSVAVDNLLDEEIRRHASALKDLAPEAGRNFRLITTLNF